jgi:hypothetical protein
MQSLPATTARRANRPGTRQTRRKSKKDGPKADGQATASQQSESAALPTETPASENDAAAPEDLTSDSGVAVTGDGHGQQELASKGGLGSQEDQNTSEDSSTIANPALSPDSALSTDSGPLLNPLQEEVLASPPDHLAGQAAAPTGSAKCTLICFFDEISEEEARAGVATRQPSVSFCLSPEISQKIQDLLKKAEAKMSETTAPKGPGAIPKRKIGELEVDSDPESPAKRTKRETVQRARARSRLASAASRRERAKPALWRNGQAFASDGSLILDPLPPYESDDDEGLPYGPSEDEKRAERAIARYKARCADEEAKWKREQSGKLIKGTPEDSEAREQDGVESNSEAGEASESNDPAMHAPVTAPTPIGEATRTPTAASATTAVVAHPAEEGTLAGGSESSTAVAPAAAPATVPRQPETPRRGWGFGSVINSVSRFVPGIRFRRTPLANQFNVNNLATAPVAATAVTAATAAATTNNAAPSAVETLIPQAAASPGAEGPVGPAAIRLPAQEPLDSQELGEREKQFIEAEIERRVKEALEKQQSQEATDTKKGTKRKWGSPEIIPNPPGCSYGLDLNYFGYNSSDDEFEDPLPAPRPVKRVRFADDAPSTPPSRSIGDPYRATPYTGKVFADPKPKRIWTPTPLPCDVHTPSRTFSVDMAYELSSDEEDDNGNEGMPELKSPTKRPIEAATNQAPKGSARATEPTKSAAQSIPTGSLSEESVKATEPTKSAAQSVPTEPGPAQSVEAAAQVNKPAGAAAQSIPTEPGPEQSLEAAAQEPPPAPTPAHATLPAPVESNALAKARAQATRFMPKTPSTLREATRVSSSPADPSMTTASSPATGPSPQEPFELLNTMPVPDFSEMFESLRDRSIPQFDPEVQAALDTVTYENSPEMREVVDGLFEVFKSVAA